jgi:HEAT repeat protein
MEALRDEYAGLLNATMKKAQAGNKSLSDDKVATLGATVDCLALIGDESSFETLGGMIITSEKAKATSIGGLSDPMAIELRALGALAKSTSLVAMEQIVRVASLGGASQATFKVHQAAIAALKTKPEAAQSVFDARAITGSDPDVSAALDEVLVALGEPAAAALLTGLGEKDWVEDLLLRIGSPAAKPLSALLGSAAEPTRVLALELLLKISAAGGPGATAVLTDQTLLSQLIDARQNARFEDPVNAELEGVMANLGTPVVEPLVAGLTTYEWAPQVLAKVGAGAVPAMKTALGGKDGDTRNAALEVLLEISAAGGVEATAILADEAMLPLLIDARQNARFEDHTNTELERVVAGLGKSAVKPLVAVLATHGWAPAVLAEIGADAVPALKTALNSKDRDTRFAAADALVLMQGDSPELVQDFTQALEESNLKYIAKNYAYYIRMGKAGTEPTLVNALNKYGNVTMCEDYLNCGSATLEEGAQAWAKKRGYSIISTPGSHGGPIWGEG